jgi:hypothetical protein
MTDCILAHPRFTPKKIKETLINPASAAHGRAAIVNRLKQLKMKGNRNSHFMLPVL